MGASTLETHAVPAFNATDGLTNGRGCVKNRSAERASDFVRLIPAGHFGANGVKLKPRRVRLLAVNLGGRDDGPVSSPLEFERDGDVRVHVAERAERRDDDALVN